MSARSPDRESRFADLLARVTRGEGTLDPALRTAAAAGSGAGALDPFVAKVHREAYAVTEADLDRLRDRDLTEDQIFELTVAAAVGAGMRRLDAAMTALRAAAKEEPR